MLRGNKLKCLVTTVIVIPVFIIDCCGALLWPLWDPLSTCFKIYKTKRDYFVTKPYYESIIKNLLCDILLLITYIIISLVVMIIGVLVAAIWWIYRLFILVWNILFIRSLLSSFSTLCHILDFLVETDANNASEINTSMEKNML